MAISTVAPLSKCAPAVILAVRGAGSAWVWALRGLSPRARDVSVKVLRSLRCANI